MRCWVAGGGGEIQPRGGSLEAPAGRTTPSGRHLGRSGRQDSGRSLSIRFRGGGGGGTQQAATQAPGASRPGGAPGGRAGEEVASRTAPAGGAALLATGRAGGGEAAPQTRAARKLHLVHGEARPAPQGEPRRAHAPGSPARRHARRSPALTFRTPEVNQGQ